MESKNKKEFLSKEIDSQLESFNEKRERNRKYAFYSHIFSSLFAFLVTVLLGLKIEGTEPLFRNLALVFGASITVINAWDAFNSYRDLWIKYTLTYSQLRALKAELDFLSSSGRNDISENYIENIFQKYQKILDTTNEEWKSIKDDISSHK